MSFWNFANNLYKSVGTLVNNIMESTNPEEANLNDFKTYWSTFLECINEVKQKDPQLVVDWVHTTHASDDLRDMIQLILEEENRAMAKNKTSESPVEAGLCLEYFMQHRLLDELCEMAVSDTPKGMLNLVIERITPLIRDLRYSLLSTNHFHKSVSSLITKSVYVYQHANPTKEFDQHLISFIQVICNKISDFPTLIDGFIDRDDTHHLVSFPLIEPLVQYIYDTSDIGKTARNVILLLSSFPNYEISYYIANATELSKLLCLGLLDTLQILSFDDIEQYYSTTEQADSNLYTFKQRLLYINELLALCQTSAQYKERDQYCLFVCLLKTIWTNIFENYLQVELLSAINDRIELCQYKIKLIFDILHSYYSPFSTLLLEFLFYSPDPNHMLFTTLVNRLDNLSQSLTISTQKLFVSILNLHHPIISTLFLSCSTSTISIASSLSSFLSQLTQVVSSTTANINTYNSLSSLVKIFTQLHTNLPVDDSDPVTLSVLQYMKDADYHYSYHQFAFSNANYDSTFLYTTFLNYPETVYDFDTTEYFMNVVKNSFSRCLHQDININLSITELISTIASIVPDSCFSSLFDVQAEKSNFMSILLELLHEKELFTTEILDIDIYQSYINNMLNIHKENCFLPMDQILSDHTLVILLKGSAVLEEFLKELFAIMKARESYASLQLHPHV